MEVYKFYQHRVAFEKKCYKISIESAPRGEFVPDVINL